LIIIYLLVYVFIIFFFFIERRLRKDNDAKTLEKSKHDKRTTDIIGLSFLVAILLLIITPLFNYYKIGIMIPAKGERRFIMPNIKPISDLRNYNEVLRSIEEDSLVFLTKNGRWHYYFTSSLLM
jgi:Na+/H+ antiporter NhaD/arsenite permease-like protein